VNFDLVRQGRIRRDCERLDGTRFPAEIAIQTAVTDQGAIYIVFIRDISRRMNAEKELVAARDAALASERIKTDFLATMSHEIRTPLNGIIGAVDLLDDTDLDPVQTRRTLTIRRSSHMLLDVINDILDFSNLDANALTYQMAPLSLPELTDVLHDVFQQRLMDAKLTLTIDGPALTVSTDEVRLRQVLVNLIGNAIKFTPAGTITVRISMPNDTRMRIEVEDSGIGIPRSGQREHVLV